MYCQIEGYGIRQCILEDEIQIGEPKMYFLSLHFFLKEKRQKMQIRTLYKFPDEFEILKKSGIQPETAHTSSKQFRFT